MATWMTHLRIADKFLSIIGENRLSLPEFVFGNVAPDCGILNADGMTYTPSKQISHYQTDGGNDYMRFANDYLKKCDDFKAKSFYLGYLLHLLTDIQWRELTVLPQIKKYGGEFDSKSALIWALKGDWYDIDRLFLRANPDFRAFKVFCETEHIANYVDFFPENAFDQQMYRIRDFYQNADCNLDREYKYMDYVDMDRFIESAVFNIKTKYFAIAECHSGKIETVGDVQFFSAE